MNEEKHQSLLELVVSVTIIEGFNKEEAQLIVTALCSMRDRVLKEHSLPGITPISAPIEEGHNKRLEDLGDPEEMILEIKTSLGETYNREDLLKALNNYK